MHPQTLFLQRQFNRDRWSGEQQVVFAANILKGSFGNDNSMIGFASF